MTTKTELPPDWDPLPEAREWYRHSTTGDRGYRVRREGKDAIRLDRPEQELIQPMHGWIRDEYGTTFPAEQIARVAFAADRAVCGIVGEHSISRQLWQDLREQDRIKFIRNGPGNGVHSVRKLVFDAIIDALEPFVRK